MSRYTAEQIMYSQQKNVVRLTAQQDANRLPLSEIARLN